MKNPIYTYTRKQALQDGLLVDLSQYNAARMFTCPVACTAPVWAIIDTAVKNPKEHNDIEGVLHDIFYLAVQSRPATAHGAHTFQVFIRGVGRRQLFSLKAYIGPGDGGEATLTFMLPHED